MLCFLSARGDFAVSDCNRKMVHGPESWAGGWVLHNRLGIGRPNKIKEINCGCNLEITKSFQI